MNLATPHRGPSTARARARIQSCRSLSPKLALAVALAAGVAEAGNDDEIPIGSEASMTGAAVTAIVQDGAAGYYKPAG